MSIILEKQHKTIMIKQCSWMSNGKKWDVHIYLTLSFTLFHTHMPKCSLFTCQKRHQTMSYSAPLWVQWEVPGPTSPHTISPKACPTPTIVPHFSHTHTHTTPEPGVPLSNSITQRHTPVLIPSEREKNDRGGRRKIATLGKDGGKWVSVTAWGCR